MKVNLFYCLLDEISIVILLFFISKGKNLDMLPVSV